MASKKRIPKDLVKQKEPKKPGLYATDDQIKNYEKEKKSVNAHNKARELKLKARKKALGYKE